MTWRRTALIVVVVAACAGEVRLDPSPSCSLRTERAEVEPAAAGAPYAGPLSDLVAGQRHACLMMNERDALCWGGNDLSQLLSSVTPAAGEGVVYDDWRGPGVPVTGGAHTCVFTDDEIGCWGNNQAGQLGRGTTEPRPGVVAVPPGPGEITALAAGLLHTCVANGPRVSCWGDNRHRQLGRDTASPCCHAPDESFVEARAIVQMAAGAYHTCALTDVDDAGEADVVCWGDDRFGALGDGEAGGAGGPVTLVGFERPVQVAAGAHHTCAVTEAGEVWCWGRNQSGELGDGTAIDRATPTFVLSADSVSAGGRVELFLDEAGELVAGDGAGRTCAIVEGTSDRGDLLCWGDNRTAAVGDGTATDALSPMSVGTGYQEVAPGGTFTCGLTTDLRALDGPRREIRCWGTNASGELGRGGPGSFEPTPATVLQGAEPT